MLNLLKRITKNYYLKWKWSPEAHLRWLQITILQDHQWLAHNHVARELTDRYLKMLVERWEQVSIEDVSQLRARLNLGHVTPSKKNWRCECNWCKLNINSRPGTWEVNIRGDRDTREWEIAVVRSEIKGHINWGMDVGSAVMINQTDLYGRKRLPGYVFDQQLKIAEEVARRLNNGECINE